MRWEGGTPTNPHSVTDRFGPLVRALERRDELSAEERRLIKQLPARVREFEAGDELVSEWSEPSESCLLISGMAARAQFVADGSRQLTALHVPGDFVDLHALMLKLMDHSVVALTRVEAAFVPHRSLLSVAEAAPHLGRMFWLSTVIDGAIERAWVTCLGRRATTAHVAHLFCELFARLEAVGLTRGNSFDFPVTQVDLADMTGMSHVHMNRTVQELRASGLITWQRKVLTILDIERLQAFADFDPLYLNLVKRPR
jgi:CRP-like cAMP-binding protein